MVGQKFWYMKMLRAPRRERVKDVIYPAVGEQILDEVIWEAETEAGYEQQVKLVTRASYSHHYRCIVPALLAVLMFNCNNERHRLLMAALALLQRYRERKRTVFIEYSPQSMGGAAIDHMHVMFRDPTNDYGAASSRKGSGIAHWEARYDPFLEDANLRLFTVR